MEKKLKPFRKAHEIPIKEYYFNKEKNVFKYIYNMFKYITARPDCLYSLGTHIITGYPGAGKTLLMNKIIKSVDSSKYFFYSNIDEFSGSKNVLHLDLNKMFQDKKQVKKLKTEWHGKHLYGVVLDEINLNFNKRGNNTREYNDVFIGLVEFIITHRHQHIPRIYFIGQKLELQDTQLISLFKYQHDIIKKCIHFRYWKYYESFIEKVPTKLKIIHRVKDEQDNFISFAKDKIKITWEDLTSYNTLALANEYDKLPEL